MNDYYLHRCFYKHASLIYISFIKTSITLKKIIHRPFSFECSVAQRNIRPVLQKLAAEVEAHRGMSSPTINSPYRPFTQPPELRQRYLTTNKTRRLLTHKFTIISYWNFLLYLPPLPSSFSSYYKSRFYSKPWWKEWQHRSENVSQTTLMPPRNANFCSLSPSPPRSRDHLSEIFSSLLFHTSISSSGQKGTVLSND